LNQTAIQASIILSTPPSPGFFTPPSHFFEFSVGINGKALLTQVNDPTSAPGTSGTDGRFLELPTGQVLWTNDGQLNPVEVATYTPKGEPKSSWLWKRAVRA
jgi:hypothetical protein